MKKVYLILLLLVVHQLYAQKAKVTASINFSGAIGNYPVELSLQIGQHSDQISGTYYYIKSGKENYIYLSGKLKDGKMTLVEKTYNVKKRKFEYTGNFQLVYTSPTLIKGTWNNGEDKRSLAVKLKCRELLSHFNPLHFDFFMTKKKPNYENVSEAALKYYSLKSLVIKSNENLQWNLSHFDEYDLVKDEIELEDVDFDGYLDVKVPIFYPDRAKNDYGFIYFVYDTKRKKFIRNESLTSLGVLRFNPVKKEVEKMDADGSGNESNTYYKWYQKKLLIKKIVSVYENDEHTYYEEYEMQNGKNLKVKSYRKRT